MSGGITRSGCHKVTLLSCLRTRLSECTQMWLCSSSLYRSWSCSIRQKKKKKPYNILLKNTSLLHPLFPCTYRAFLASSHVEHVNFSVLCETGPLCERMCTRLSGWPLWPRSSTLTASLLLTSGVVAMLCYTGIKLQEERRKERKLNYNSGGKGALKGNLCAMTEILPSHCYSCILARIISVEIFF